MPVSANTEEIRPSDLVALRAVIYGKATLLMDEDRMVDSVINGRVLHPRYRIARLERLLRLVDGECAYLTREETEPNHRRIEVGPFAEETAARLAG